VTLCADAVALASAKPSAATSVPIRMCLMIHVNGGVLRCPARKGTRRTAATTHDTRRVSECGRSRCAARRGGGTRGAGRAASRHVALSRDVAAGRAA
jgi:hypothetical protein